MTPPITHAKARQVICLLCFDKDTNARRIKENLERLTKEFCFSDLDIENEQLPHSVCGTCRVTLLAYEKGDFSRKLTLLTVHIAR